MLTRDDSHSDGSVISSATRKSASPRRRLASEYDNIMVVLPPTILVVGVRE